MKILSTLILSLIFLLTLSPCSQADPPEKYKRSNPADWSRWTPPKYIPNWNGVRAELLQPSLDLTRPPEEPVRWTAQWEPREGCLIAWPIGWTSTYSAFCEMVDNLQSMGVVYMLYHSEMSRDFIMQLLANAGVFTDSCEWLNIRYDSNWTRDYGPQNIWGLQTDNWGIVDNICLYGHNDNNVNPELEALWRMDYYESPILCEGGNLCTDGMGRLFCTREILVEAQFMQMTEEELRQYLWDYLNVELIVLPMPRISPHLDMSAKLVDAETWIIGEWPPDDPNTPYMDEMISILDTMTASTGNPYTIFRVQQPDSLPNGYWRTYTNSYIQNGKVLLAVYGVEQDSAAISVFQQAMPGYEIIPINCAGFDNSGGAIHCSTHGIAWHGDDYLFNGEVSEPPGGPPMQIPPYGGSFEFWVEITNNDTLTVNTEFWTEAVTPGGDVKGPLIFQGNVHLEPGQSWDRDYIQNVPGTVPAGIYYYRYCVGSYLPRIIVDLDSFQIEKMGDGDDFALSDWSAWEIEKDSENESLTVNLISTDFKIFDAYPNPFNPETTFKFGLQSAGMVKLSVYNIAGQKLAELANGHFIAGYHQIEWNAGNLSSGIYYARLNAGGEVQTMKCLLLK